MRHISQVSGLDPTLPLFIFGAGAGGGILFQELDDAERFVWGFIDDTRQGLFHDRDIISLAEFAATAPAEAIVLIASQHWRAIARQVQAAGNFVLVNASQVIRRRTTADTLRRIRQERQQVEQAVKTATGHDGEAILTVLQQGALGHGLADKLQRMAQAGRRTVFIQGSGGGARMAARLVELEPRLLLAGYVHAGPAGFLDHVDVCPQDIFWRETKAGEDTVLVVTEDWTETSALARHHGFHHLVDATAALDTTGPTETVIADPRPLALDLDVVEADDDGNLWTMLSAGNSLALAWCPPGCHLGSSDAKTALALLAQPGQRIGVLIGDGKAPTLLDLLFRSPGPVSGILVLFRPALAALGIEPAMALGAAQGFDLWRRLLCEFEINAIAATDSKVAPGVWNGPGKADMDARVAIVHDLFGETGFFSTAEDLRQLCLLRQFAAAANAGLAAGEDARGLVDGLPPSAPWRPITLPAVSARVIGAVARRHEQRGQLPIAMATWDAGADLHDTTLDADGGQAFLKHPDGTMAQQYRRMLDWARRHTSIEWCQTTIADDWRQRPIRVGYVCAFGMSSYFRFQVLPFVRHHDRDRFQVFLYIDHTTTEAQAAAHTVRSVAQLDDDGFAALIRADAIDILVEVTGFSPGHRYAALAQRCAPIQISYINHTGTSGTANVDYCLSDAIATPADMDCWFTEKLWRLSGSFFCFDFSADRFPPVAPLPMTHNGFATFGCFASGSKINDRLVRIWARLLARLPTARMVLCNEALLQPSNRALLLRQFTWAGITADRLDIRPGVDRETIKTMYGEIDVSLDTWPYCGGNTIAESLMCGVPVVSLQGDTFAARYGASLLTASGLPDLIAADADQYVTIAAALAGDPRRLAELRRTMRERVFQHGFSDSARFAGVLEQAYEAMLDRITGPVE